MALNTLLSIITLTFACHATTIKLLEHSTALKWRQSKIECQNKGYEHMVTSSQLDAFGRGNVWTLLAETTQCKALSDTADGVYFFTADLWTETDDEFPWPKVCASNYYKYYSTNQVTTGDTTVYTLAWHWEGLDNCFEDDEGTKSNQCILCYRECNWGCYIARYPDLIQVYGSNFVGAAAHYAAYGQNEGRYCDCNAHDSCNWDCYLSRYPDIQNVVGDNYNLAAKHYFDFGLAESRNCKCTDNDDCNWVCYLNNYPDLQNAYGVNQELAAQHYSLFGKNEGRNCKCSGSGSIPIKPVNNAPSDPSPSTWTIYLSSSWITIIAALLIIIVLLNVYLMGIGYRNCCKPRKNVYSSVKFYDSESDHKPINI